LWGEIVDARSIDENVVRFVKVVSKIKPLRSRGELRYGIIQTVVPKDFVGCSALVVIYVLREKPIKRTPLEVMI
jgi:hypothetical protein